MANQLKLVATIAPANTAVEASTDNGATWRAIAMETVGSQQEGILTNVPAATYAANSIKLRAVAFPAVVVSEPLARTVLAATLNAAADLMALGDSLTAGALAANQDSYTNVLRRTLPADRFRLSRILQLGAGGRQAGPGDGNYTTTAAVNTFGIDEMYRTVLPRYRADRACNIVVLMMGVNDLQLGGRTPAAIYADLKTMCRTMRRHGFKVVVMAITAPYEQNGVVAFDSRGVNALIRNGWQNDMLAHDFVDIEADRRINNTRTASGVDPNIEYWTSDAMYGSVVDAIHLGPLGYAVIAELLQPKLLALQAAVSVIPAAPTAPVNGAGTFGATLSGAVSTHEYTLNGGRTLLDLTANPQPLPANFGGALNFVGIRKRSIGNNPPSAWCFNTAQFSGTAGEGVPEYVPVTNARVYDWQSYGHNLGGSGWNKSDPAAWTMGHNGTDDRELVPLGPPKQYGVVGIPFTDGVKLTQETASGLGATYSAWIDDVFIGSQVATANGQILFEAHFNDGLTHKIEVCGTLPNGAFCTVKGFTIWAASAVTSYPLEANNQLIEYLSNNASAAWQTDANGRYTTALGDFIRVAYSKGIKYTAPSDATALVSILIDGAQRDITLVPGQEFVNELPNSGSHTMVVRHADSNTTKRLSVRAGSIVLLASPGSLPTGTKENLVFNDARISYLTTGQPWAVYADFIADDRLGHSLRIPFGKGIRLIGAANGIGNNAAVTLRISENGGPFVVVKTGNITPGQLFYENYATSGSNVFEAEITTANGAYFVIDNGTFSVWN